MTIEELKENIVKNNIPDDWYSLDDGLKNEALILYKNYAVWESFYFERGGRSSFRTFDNDSDAYDFLWSQLLILQKSMNR